MAERKIQAFFYGSFIDMTILDTFGLKKRPFAPASLAGFDIVIQPTANLIESGDGVVYGVLANFTHDELDALEVQHKKLVTDAVYNIEPVIIHTRGGKIVPAITHLCTNMQASPADQEYIDRIIKAASTYGFPGWYINKLSSFRV